MKRFCAPKTFTWILAIIFLPMNLLGQASGTTLSKCPYSGLHAAEKDTSDKVIICPFLDIAQPDTSGYEAFAQSCQKAGMQYFMAKFVAKNTGKRQRGKKAVRAGKTPDLYRLDEVMGISHLDLYQRHLNEVMVWMEKMQIDDILTLQDLVTMKKRIAALEGVEISKASKIETALLFIGAGGNMENWTVKRSDVQLFLHHQLPGVPIEVTIKKLRKTRRAAKWKS